MGPCDLLKTAFYGRSASRFSRERRPARFSAWLAGWPAGRLAVAARPGQPAAPLPSRRLTRARPATPLETRPAAGHIRAGLNSSRPSPPAARLAGSAERLAGSAERLAGSAEPRRLGGQPDLGLGRPGGRPDLSGGPAGFGPRPAGWPAGFFGRPSRIWAVGRPDLGGRPAGFGGSAGRFWGVGWPGRPGGQPLTTDGSTTTYRAPVPKNETVYRYPRRCPAPRARPASPRHRSRRSSRAHLLATWCTRLRRAAGRSRCGAESGEQVPVTQGLCQPLDDGDTAVPCVSASATTAYKTQNSKPTITALTNPSTKVF